MIMKELIRDVDMTSKTVTTSTTEVTDVLERGDIILAVSRNSKDRCGLVHYIYEYDDERGAWEGKLTVLSPTFTGTTCKRSIFDTLWELQGFYDLVVFDNMLALGTYTQDNKLEWGK